MRPAVRRQRLAAYVVAVRDAAGAGADREVLLTRLSSTTGRPEHWTLPGGGVEHGEHPVAAVVRETHEETGLEVVPGPVLDVDSVHRVGRGPGGDPEDFHAVRVVYTAASIGGGAPRVVDVGGSTDRAAWVSLDDVRRGRTAVVPLVRTALARAGELPAP